MLGSTPNRRDFFRSSASLAASGMIMPYWCAGNDAQAAEMKSKNDRLHIGAIGVGGQGTEMTKSAAKFGDVVAVCDVDLKHGESAKAIFDGKPVVYQDHHKLLDRKDIEVAVYGTPDHWHTAVNVAARKSGRDVYTEKPLSLTIEIALQSG